MGRRQVPFRILIPPPDYCFPAQTLASAAAPCRTAQMTKMVANDLRAAMLAGKGAATVCRGCCGRMLGPAGHFKPHQLCQAIEYQYLHQYRSQASRQTSPKKTMRHGFPNDYDQTMHVKLGEWGISDDLCQPTDEPCATRHAKAALESG